MSQPQNGISIRVVIPWEGAILGVVRLIQKHWKSLLRCMRQERLLYPTVYNAPWLVGVTLHCPPWKKIPPRYTACRQNSLTICSVCLSFLSVCKISQNVVDGLSHNSCESTAGSPLEWEPIDDGQTYWLPPTFFPAWKSPPQMGCCSLVYL